MLKLPLLELISSLTDEEIDLRRKRKLLKFTQPCIAEPGPETSPFTIPIILHGPSETEILTISSPRLVYGLFK